MFDRQFTRRVPSLGTGFAAVAILAISGCGSDGPPVLDVYPTAGKLVLDGEPFGPALVMLTPTAKEGRTTVGVADAQGQITFTSYEAGDGIPAGSYKVTVTSDATTGPFPKPIPRLYTNPQSTPLTVTVEPKEDNAVTISMDSKAGPPARSAPGVPGTGPDATAPAFSAGTKPESD